MNQFHWKTKIFNGVTENEMLDIPVHWKYLGFDLTKLYKLDTFEIYKKGGI